MNMTSAGPNSMYPIPSETATIRKALIIDCKQKSGVCDAGVERKQTTTSCHTWGAQLVLRFSWQRASAPASALQSFDNAMNWACPHAWWFERKTKGKPDMFAGSLNKDTPKCGHPACLKDWLASPLPSRRKTQTPETRLHLGCSCHSRTSPGHPIQQLYFCLDVPGDPMTSSTANSYAKHKLHIKRATPRAIRAGGR